MALPSRTRAAPTLAPGAVTPPQPRLNLHSVDDPDRAAVEAFIRRIYAERYGAHVSQFAPTLVSLCDAEGAIVAAAGYRQATHAPLFLERYLGASIEAVLTERSGVVVARSGIVEVGHLASNRAGEGRRLIHLLGPHLAARGCVWVVSTLTTELRHLFVRIGVTPLALASADPAALGADARHWGRYYEHHPVVLAGHLPHALRTLARRRDAGKAQ